MSWQPEDDIVFIDHRPTMHPQLSSNHFLSQPRPDANFGPPTGVVDTTTLAAHDFDVDTRTGFMPPQPPIHRLPQDYESWEVLLEQATSQRLKLGSLTNLSTEDISTAESWRASVRKLAPLPISDLKKSELTLRRAHLVLAWILHFYVHTLPPDSSVAIPRSITLPLLQISAQLQLPPVLTYSDTVLYNWDHRTPLPSVECNPRLDNLRSPTLFTGTTDEEEFFLSSARIELKGVDVLELMQVIMDEAFVGDDIAIRRITTYLRSMAEVMQELKTLLLGVKDGCNPDVFYHAIRPWFKGMDSDPQSRPWVFEGIEEDPSLSYPAELSGPSAGQSSLIHAIDIFLGVSQYSHDASITGSASSTSSGKSAFLQRMQLYMPRHHRNFLNHLASSPRPIRAIVETAKDDALLEAYNAAVKALKEFRDGHMIIVALYIIQPSKRPWNGEPRMEKEQQHGEQVLKGTGGTELVKFLKDVRDRTTGAILPQSTQS